MGIERKLLNHIGKLYPKPMHVMLHNPLNILTEMQEKRAQNEKKLIQLLSRLPHWGIGRIVTSFEWERSNPTFWRITRVHVDHETDNFEYGLVWGVLTTDGRSRYYEESIVDANEHLWRLIPKYEEDYYLNYKPQSKPIKEFPLYVTMPPLMSRIFKMQNSKEKKKVVNDEPMVRYVLERNPKQVIRQKLDDGTLV